MEVDKKSDYYYAFISNEVIVRQHDYFNLKGMQVRVKSCHFIKNVPVNMHGNEGVTDFPIIVKYDKDTDTITDAITGEIYKGTIHQTKSYIMSAMLGDKLSTDEVARWEELLREIDGVEKYYSTMEHIKRTLANLQMDLEGPKRKLEMQRALA